MKLFCIIMVIIGTNLVCPVENSIRINSIELTPTFNCIGAVVKYDGDDNNNAVTRIIYRLKDQYEWQDGYPLFRITEKRFAGSLFWLKANSIYEVLVKIEDPDDIVGASTISVTGRTRSEILPKPIGNIMNVTPADDLNNIINNLKAGDTLIFKKGIYYGSIKINVSGENDNPVILKSESNGEVILDGSEPGFKPIWLFDSQKKAFYCVCKNLPLYVASGEEQLYRYSNLDAFLKNDAKANGYWYYDEKTKTMFCKFKYNKAPQEADLNISFSNSVIQLEKANNIIIEGFNIRFAGTGVQLISSSNNWILKNTIKNCGGGIEIYNYDSSNNVLESNVITDTSVTSWEWKFVKSTYFERSGISLEGGSGNVVRFNLIRGFFNGIAASTWDELYETRYNRDIDVYGNEISDIGDDGWEPEGCCINTRFWGNVIFNILHPISLAPITVGPIYVLRNIMYDFKGGSGAFKFNVGISEAQGNMLICHNTAFTNVKGINALTLTGNIPPSNIIFRNNILYGTRYIMEDMTDKSGNQFDLDYDLWFKLPEEGKPVVKWRNERCKTFEEWQTKSGKEMHGIYKEPMFIDPENLNFSLTDESPAIDTGIILPGINYFFKGMAPDIGAVEMR